MREKFGIQTTIGDGAWVKSFRFDRDGVSIEFTQEKSEAARVSRKESAEAIAKAAFGKVKKVEG